MSKIVAQHLADQWSAYHGDTVDVAKGIPDNSVDFSLFSPPFCSLYTYSNSPRDMGNCRDDAEFFEHYKHLIREQMRAMKPGRNVSIHCMLMPTSKERDGYIGLRDFRGDIIRAYQEVGFILHSEVVIWKDPVMAMQRTKALGLLHKQIKKDSAMSRQGIPDYVVTMQKPENCPTSVVTMRKPGRNPDPIEHTPEEFPVDLWQKYASPVWMDIDPSDTLQYRSAREHDDERHICPLQLEVIRRLLFLWSRPGDVVWSPFMGIGSEGHEALKMKRRFVGAELKTSYYEQAVRNLTEAAAERQASLF